MDLPWGDDKTTQFITNVGLVTSDGPYGPNIMACEWTHQVSYSPGLIAVCIGFHKATLDNIKKTKEFGVNICSTDQSVMSSVSGGYTGKEFDKIKALEELGFKFFKAKKIKVPMVEGAVVNIECKLFKQIPLGDHIMIVGEVVDASLNPDKKPLALHDGRYWKMSETLQKPSQDERDKIAQIVKKHNKK